jgi:serine/tyrosine/threonine adenylyltransferase
MDKANPVVIPRTHLIEAAIKAAVAGDLGTFKAMLGAVTAPYVSPPELFTRPPKDSERVRNTFCGT